MKQNISSTYLVALYLKEHKGGKICKMKTCCKANNIGQRVLSLRKMGWLINTICDGVIDNVQVFRYQLEKAGKMPKQFRNFKK